MHQLYNIKLNSNIQSIVDSFETRIKKYFSPTAQEKVKENLIILHNYFFSKEHEDTDKLARTKFNYFITLSEKFKEKDPDVAEFLYNIVDLCELKYSLKILLKCINLDSGYEVNLLNYEKFRINTTDDLSDCKRNLEIIMIHNSRIFEFIEDKNLSDHYKKITFGIKKFIENLDNSRYSSEKYIEKISSNIDKELFEEYLCEIAEYMINQNLHDDKSEKIEKNIKFVRDSFKECEKIEIDEDRFEFIQNTCNIAEFKVNADYFLTKENEAKKNNAKINFKFIKDSEKLSNVLKQIFNFFDLYEDKTKIFLSEEHASFYMYLSLKIRRSLNLIISNLSEEDKKDFQKMRLPTNVSAENFDDLLKKLKIDVSNDNIIESTYSFAMKMDKYSENSISILYHLFEKIIAKIKLKELLPESFNKKNILPESLEIIRNYCLSVPNNQIIKFHNFEGSLLPHRKEKLLSDLKNYDEYVKRLYPPSDEEMTRLFSNITKKKPQAPGKKNKNPPKKEVKTKVENKMPVIPRGVKNNVGYNHIIEEPKYIVVSTDKPHVKKLKPENKKPSDSELNLQIPYILSQGTYTSIALLPTIIVNPDKLFELIAERNSFEEFVKDNHSALRQLNYVSKIIDFIIEVEFEENALRIFTPKYTYTIFSNAKIIILENSSKFNYSINENQLNDLYRMLVETSEKLLNFKKQLNIYTRHYISDSDTRKALASIPDNQYNLIIEKINYKSPSMML